MRAVPTDAAGILEERVSSLRASTDRPIDLSLEAPLPSVVADPTALATVVDHLLDNAVKYSPGGEPVVLAAHAEEPTVVVEVTDQGIGMSEEQVRHLLRQVLAGGFG